MVMSSSFVSIACYLLRTTMDVLRGTCLQVMGEGGKAVDRGI